MTRRPWQWDPIRNGIGNGMRRDPYWCEWGVVVGDRVRRLRQDRNLRLADLAALVDKPDGGHYSLGFFSRLERGWASGPLAAYENIAHAFEIEPGRLLGPTDAQQDATEAEMTLIRVLRQMRIRPHDAIARLVRAEEARGSSPTG
jgi:transcriptional regulator with XRE-family HTH domain